MHSPETVRSTPCYQLAPTAIPCEAADWFDPLSSHYNKLFPFFASSLLLQPWPCCWHQKFHITDLAALFGQFTGQA